MKLQPKILASYIAGQGYSLERSTKIAQKIVDTTRPTAVCENISQPHLWKQKIPLSKVA